MIRNTIFFNALLLFVAGCATHNGFKTTQSFGPANFLVSDVYINMVDGLENSKRIRGLMINASNNTADIYNATVNSEVSEYPLEIEVTNINYQTSKSSVSNDDRTYIRYIATLREEETGEVYRELPVTYYHVGAGALGTPEDKEKAEKNMISISLKNTFARLYGKEEIPQTVEAHFSSQDIFADPNKILELPVASPSEQISSKSKSPVSESISSTDVPVIESTSTDGEPIVIKCVVC